MNISFISRIELTDRYIVDARCSHRPTVNQEWYRGHVLNDPSRRSALFPHNYVQKMYVSFSPFLLFLRTNIPPPFRPRDVPPTYPSVSAIPPPMTNPDHNEKQPLYQQPQPQLYPQEPPQWHQVPPPIMYNNQPPPGQPQPGFPYNPQQQPPPPPSPAQLNEPPTVPAKKPSKFGKVGGQVRET